MPRERPSKSLNLMPIVNLATLLVPMGLMVSQFVVVQWWRSVPAPMAGENVVDARVHDVDLVVRILEEGFELRGAEAVLAGPGGRPVLPCIGPCGDDTYDVDGLQRLLGHVKAAYPWADEVVIERRADVSYTVLVTTAQAVRRTPEGRELFPRIALR
jgi:hypothetical protein